MVPIYDSDVAEERWSKTEWSHYELWERVEQRLRRHNRLWILGTAVIFLLLSSVPIVADQVPHWTSLSAVRKLGQQIAQLKREAALEHFPFRIRFIEENSLIYQVERLTQCSDAAGSLVRTGSLVGPENVAQYQLLGRQAGEQLSIPGLVQEFCYDPLLGSAAYLKGEATVGFAVLPVHDLTERRLDRVSILLLNGPSAEVSFE